MFERCLYFNLNALTRKVNKIWEQAFQEFDLSPAHAYLLRVVLANPGITQQGIATELKLEKSTIARFVEALEDKGYLLRNKSGREQFVFPTDAAQAIGEQLEQQGKALYQRMLDNLGQDSVVKLVGDLREVSSKLN
jgi:DNA-binding MarR family transcriptional regulator